MADAIAGRATRCETACCRVLVALALLANTLPALAAEATVRADAPQRYTVVEGDTLWDITARFLAEPWLWPEVWEMNPGIENPDQIQPGDQIELTYVEGAPVLRLATTDEPDLPTVKLSPQIRREPLLSPVPVIPLELIEAYLSEDGIISEAAFAAAPYILQEASGRTLASTGDEILARGQWQPDLVQYDIIRSGARLQDSAGGAALGLEAIVVGKASIARANDEQAILRVDRANQEIRVGDRLVPHVDPNFEALYRPVPPGFALTGEIIGIPGGKAVAGRNDSLILNLGRDAGLVSGHLLTVRGADRVIDDQLGEPGAWVKVKQVLGFDDGHKAVYPGSSVASVLIYRVFDETSLGLVLSSNQPLQIRDQVVAP